MLTKPQYQALAKWRDGRPANHRGLRVRWDVWVRLTDQKLLKSAGLLQQAITPAGIAALEAYEAKLAAKVKA